MTTQTPTPASLTAFALLCRLTIAKPQLTAKDMKATKDAEDANHASGAGQYRKDLYPKHLIAPILEVESSARAFIAKHTIENVLPSARFMWFADELGKLEVAFMQAVTVFLNNYTNTLAEARVHQGDLFDAGLYPDTSALRARFNWQVNYSPVADNSAFARLLAPMEEAAQQRLTEQVTRQVQTQQEGLVSSSLSRLKEVVAHLATSTAKPDRTIINKVTGGIDVKPPIFRQTMVDNIEDCVALLRGYADALPPEATALLDRACVLTMHNANTLKDNPEVRKETQDTSLALLKDIDQLLGIDPTPDQLLGIAPDELPPPPAEVTLDLSNAELDALDALLTKELGLSPAPHPTTRVEDAEVDAAPKEQPMIPGLFDSINDLYD